MKKVAVFGGFDGVHTGHLHYFKKAREHGDTLIVLIARDHGKWSFRRKYNLPEDERKLLIEELGVADEVMLGSEDDPFEKMRKIQPDVIAITSFHKIDEMTIKKGLEDFQIDAEIVQIPVYKPELYNDIVEIR